LKRAEDRAPGANEIKLTTPSPKIRWAIFFFVALLALAVRLPQLGERPMHTDESVNAWIVGEILGGESFHYDPQDRHGPALAAETLPIVRLSGAKKFSDLTESQLRLAPVLAGAATVLLFGVAVEMFGFIACLVAALLFAFAPLPVYYSRDFIHETLFVAATFGLILSGWRALQKKNLPSAALAGFCAALMLACKETAVIHFFAIAIAVIACRFNFGTPISRSARPENVHIIAGRETGAPIAKIIFTASAVFIFTTILLFTWFGRNWSVFSDLLRAVPNFAARAGGEGHEKPFWYFAKLLGGWSGGAILGLATLGIFAVAKSRGQDNESQNNAETTHAVSCKFANTAFFFILIYGIVIAVIYSAIPYKTPWLALNFWPPLSILAGVAVQWLWFVTTKIPARAVICVCILALGFLIARDTREWVFKFPADEKNPYAYVQTGEDLLGLPVRLDELTRQNKISNPRIAVVAADPWPLPWYLRKYSHVGFWQPGQETDGADFFITSTEVSGKLAERLKNFRPEYFGVRPNVLVILWTPAPAGKLP
jgi:uncharacterized protein (TIGR03663 family)